MKLLLFILITSCAQYFPPIRGQYVLTSMKHFMVSNMYVNPAGPNQEGRYLVIHYDVIVKNIDNRPHPIDLSKSTISLSEHKFPMACERFKERDAIFSLENGAQTRILCKTLIDRSLGKNQSDYQAKLEIPLDQDVAKFNYLLRAEDFR